MLANGAWFCPEPDIPHRLFESVERKIFSSGIFAFFRIDSQNQDKIPSYATNKGAKERMTHC